MKKHQWVSLLMCAGLLAGQTSNAEGFYFGLAGGISSPDLPSKSAFDDTFEEMFNEVGLSVVDGDSSLDDEGTAWGLQVGYRWNKYVGAELGYIDFGKGLYKADAVISDGVVELPTTYSIRFLSSGPTLSAVGFLPLGDRFDLHAKAGVLFANARVREKVTIPAMDLSAQNETKDRSKDLFAAIGAAWNITDGYALRIEYQRFFDVGDDDTGEVDIDVATISVLFR